VSRALVLEETQEREEIIERVAALDIGKASLVCCVRVPNDAKPGRPRLQAAPGCRRSTPTRR
jgi:transposase